MTCGNFCNILRPDIKGIITHDALVGTPTIGDDMLCLEHCFFVVNLCKVNADNKVHDLLSGMFRCVSLVFIIQGNCGQ